MLVKEKQAMLWGKESENDGLDGMRADERK